MYSQTLQRYLNLANSVSDQFENKNEEKEEESRISDQMIVESVPKTFRNKAKTFLDFMKHMKNLTWDKNGTVHVNGRPVHGSHIVDIVNDAVRRRRNFIAAGRGVISKALRSAGVPRAFMANEDFWAEGSDIESRPAANDGVSENMSFAEPDRTWRDMSGINTINSSTIPSPSTSYSNASNSPPLQRLGNAVTKEEEGQTRRHSISSRDPTRKALRKGKKVKKSGRIQQPTPLSWEKY